MTHFFRSTHRNQFRGSRARRRRNHRTGGLRLRSTGSRRKMPGRACRTWMGPPPATRSPRTSTYWKEFRAGKQKEAILVFELSARVVGRLVLGTQLQRCAELDSVRKKKRQSLEWSRLKHTSFFPRRLGTRRGLVAKKYNQTQNPVFNHLGRDCVLHGSAPFFKTLAAAPSLYNGHQNTHSSPY